MLRLRAHTIVLGLLAFTLTAAVVGMICRCWRTSTPVSESGVACPPVRTSLAMLALAENPTARTYVTLGPGVGAFTNVFAHAGLVAVTNGAETADLVFVSGDVSKGSLARAWERCATNGLLAVHCDVRKLTFDAFGKRLAALPEEDWRLWFPGRSDALVAVRRPVDAAPSPRQGNGSAGSDGRGQTVRVYNKSRLSDLLDLFVREELFGDLARAGIDSLPVLLASYAGSRAEALPVFGFAQGEVVPECFVLKEISPMDWIDCAGVDADVREPLSAEIRSMLVIRRLVLQGDIQARAGKKDAAMDAWTKAIRRNPNDSLILERICQLDVNAETFLKVGNFPMAAQCLETMVCLRPKDVQTIRRLARVFQQMGQKEKAAAVTKRADELVKAKMKKRENRK